MTSPFLTTARDKPGIWRSCIKARMRSSILCPPRSTEQAGTAISTVRVAERTGPLSYLPPILIRAHRPQRVGHPVQHLVDLRGGGGVVHIHHGVEYHAAAEQRALELEEQRGVPLSVGS